jgi:hypothetical protein
MTTIILTKVGCAKSRVLNEGGAGGRVGVVRTAPSVRVPVTEANRAYLRDLRRAELAAWREARGGTVCRRG